MTAGSDVCVVCVVCIHVFSHWELLRWLPPARCRCRSPLQDPCSPSRCGTCGRPASLDWRLPRTRPLESRPPLCPLTSYRTPEGERGEVFIYNRTPRTPCVLMRSEFGGSFIKLLMSCWTISRRAFVSCQSRFKPMSSSQCSGLHPLIRWHCVYVQLFICDSCKYLNLPTFNDYWRETIREGVKSTWLTTALSNHL